MARAYSTVEQFSVGFDRQREWIERRGLLLLTAFYLGGVGGGLFLASLIIGWKAGIPIALGIVALGKGPAHMLYLGRPLRFWRAFRRPHSSWISRGIYFMMSFILFGILYYVFYENTALAVFSGFFAFALEGLLALESMGAALILMAATVVGVFAASYTVARRL